MIKQPIAEVFGYPIENDTPQAMRHKEQRLCPFNNKVPNCTKDKAADPLGVCSVLEDSKAVITCPVRFREDWIIASDASSFFFPANTKWTSLTEIKLADADGAPAGNIDVLLVSYDPNTGMITDFGGLEVQAVYISGNIRNAFSEYIKDSALYITKDWSRGNYGQLAKDYPSPDYLSSSRKRLVPQILYKGTILHTWGKKQAIAIQESFFETLPSLPEVPQEEAEMAWILYDLQEPVDPRNHQRKLIRTRTVHTKFQDALQVVTRPNVGKMEEFQQMLQNRLNEKLASPPDAPTLLDKLTE